jgi:Recombination endonuclease VII
MANADEKTCTKCREPKPVTAFYKQGKYRRSVCIECTKESVRGSYSRTSQEIKDGRKRRATARRYGLTLEEYDVLVAEHQHCPICLTTDPGGVGWAVDHNHETGKVRGILCSECNLAIGKLRDNVANLTRAQVYLEVTSDQS